ncbi:unnamed protein product [Gadus morhua 'NCC']
MASRSRRCRHDDRKSRRPSAEMGVVVVEEMEVVVVEEMEVVVVEEMEVVVVEIWDERLCRNRSAVSD